MIVSTDNFQNLVADEVQALDPLDADKACYLLREQNGNADVRGIVGSVHGVLPDADRLSRLGLVECLAAVRDLGLFAGSLKRHGVEPVKVVPELEPVLIELGRRTEMVPRDTVHHYVTWSPAAGVRARLYTSDPMEERMKSAARMSLPQLASAVDLCVRLNDLEPTDPAFGDAFRELASRMALLEPSIDIILHYVTPEFFARTMRPYFEEITIDGQSYLGPAAAHVPLSLVDLALWSADHGDEVYAEFWRESALYSLPAWRRLYECWAGGSSLVTRVVNAWRAAGGQPAEAVRVATGALSEALRSLVVFRGKHLRIARQAYDEQLRLYPLGSGGGSLDLLADVVKLTRDNATLVRNSLVSPRAHAAVNGRSRES